MLNAAQNSACLKIKNTAITQPQQQPANFVVDIKKHGLIKELHDSNHMSGTNAQPHQEDAKQGTTIA